MKFFVSMDFKSKGDTELNTFGGTVLSNLTGDADYTAIASLIDPDLKTAATAYDAALKVSATGGTPSTAIKNQKREALLDILDKVARNVNLIAEGDEAKILKTGFEAYSTEKNVQPDIAKGEIVSVKRGDAPCEAVLQVKPLESVAMYAVEWSVDNGQIWHNGTYSSKKKFKVVTSVPKTDTWFRIRGLGRKDRKGSWSDPVSVYVV